MQAHELLVDLNLCTITELNSKPSFNNMRKLTTKKHSHFSTKHITSIYHHKFGSLEKLNKIYVNCIRITTQKIAQVLNTVMTSFYQTTGFPQSYPLIVYESTTKSYHSHPYSVINIVMQSKCMRLIAQTRVNNRLLQHITEKILTCPLKPMTTHSILFNYRNDWVISLSI